MAQMLDYAIPANRKPSRWLSLAANGSLFYLLLPLIALYSQWLLSWYMLGHRPAPSMNDPKSITGANWMHPMTGIALLGFFPAAFVSGMLNLAYFLDRRPPRNRFLMRLLGFGVAWFGALGLILADPARVLYWWMD